MGIVFGEWMALYATIASCGSGDGKAIGSTWTDGTDGTDGTVK